MHKKFGIRGRCKILPIISDELVEIVLSIKRHPALIFESDNGHVSELNIWDKVLLTHGKLETEFDRACQIDEKREFAAQLADILGQKVTDAVAEPDGKLCISFSSKFSLVVIPTTEYEAWQFQHPRPGRPIGGDINNSISLVGTNGGLITFG